MKVEHRLLAKAGDAKQAGNQVRKFFKDYELVFYDEIAIEETEIISASSPDFWTSANLAIGRNRQIIQSLLSELSLEGYGHFEDIAEIPQGYLSKIFHVLAHLLDGFFGIDSCFYNLPEGSHWISKKLQKEIESAPEEYWLVMTTGSSSEPGGEPAFSFRQQKQVMKQDFLW